MTFANPAFIAGSDERPVLILTPLKPGFARENLSRVGDPIWDLNPAVFRDNTPHGHATVDFAVLGHCDIQAMMRAYLYARLNFDIPGARTRLPPTSLRKIFNRIRRFFAFVHERLGALQLHRVDQPLLDAYAKQLLEERKRIPATNTMLLDAVMDLYYYRNHLPGGGLPFEPWGNRYASQVAGLRYSSENTTPRIPEAIITPLLAWSLRYISDFAPDILAARRELEDLKLRRSKMLAADRHLPTAERRQLLHLRLKRYLAKRRKQGRGVPVWGRTPNNAGAMNETTGLLEPVVNFQLLHLHIGVDAVAEPSMHITFAPGIKATLEDAIARGGIERGGVDTPISINPLSGIPWRSRFDARSLITEERMLQAAAYIVCSYLTGMRDSEVQAMQRGCLSSTRSEDGLLTRYAIRSTTYKGKDTIGAPAEWVTIKPVADAIKVLEQLSRPAADAQNLKTLWPVLSLKKGKTPHISAEIGRQLNEYMGHLNTLFGTPDKPAIPHGPDGKPWQITTRQFRRTVAWHIANRPFGSVAGMIQYKHASIAAFEGYSGSSASGFRREVEAQQKLGQLDDLLDYFDQRQLGMVLSGPAGPRIASALDNAAPDLDPLPAVLADRARLRVMLASLARTLHVGVLADCFFDPATALCLKRSTQADNARPLTVLCEPTRCPNACISSRHRPAWQTSADDARALLREKRLSTLQRTALRQDLDRIEDVLSHIDGSTPAPRQAAIAITQADPATNPVQPS